MPVELIVPTVLFPPPTPSTDHETEVFVSPWMVAVNCCVAEGAISTPLVGERPNVKTVTGALPVSDVFAALVATTL